MNTPPPTWETHFILCPDGKRDWCWSHFPAWKAGLRLNLQAKWPTGRIYVHGSTYLMCFLSLKHHWFCSQTSSRTVHVVWGWLSTYFRMWRVQYLAELAAALFESWIVLVWEKKWAVPRQSMCTYVRMHVLCNLLSLFVQLDIYYTLTVWHIRTRSEPRAAVGTICELKMPGEPFLIKRDETSVVCTAEPGEMLDGYKYWFCLFSPCGIIVVDQCWWIFALINDQRLKSLGSLR